MELVRCLLLLLLSLSNAEAKCGGIRKCSCVTARIKTMVVTCVNHNFVKIPQFADVIKKNVEQLILRGNYIQMLDNDSIQGYNHVHLIDVRFQKHGMCVPSFITNQDITVLGACDVSKALFFF